MTMFFSLEKKTLNFSLAKPKSAMMKHLTLVLIVLGFASACTAPRHRTAQKDGVTWIEGENNRWYAKKNTKTEQTRTLRVPAR